MNFILQYLLKDIGIQLSQAPQLFSDNLSALYMTVNPMFHPQSKHIAIDYHFVRKKVALRNLITRFIRSQHQIANIFTKALAKSPFQSHRSKLEVHFVILSNLKTGEEGNKSNILNIDIKIKAHSAQTNLETNVFSF